jgi:hypothetical protein
MSKVKIEGNASGTGTLTIAAPNTNSDYSITLPEVTGGEFVVTDSSGNVGIGTSSPSSYYATDLVISADNQGGITIVGGTGDTGQYLMFADGTSGADRFRGYLQYSHDYNAMLFATDGSERMRIDSDGDVFVGASSFASGSRVKQFEINASTIALKSGTTSTGFQYHQEFHNPNGFIGSITTNGSATAFNTSSDYRLKEDWQPMSGSIDRVKALNPVNFAWKIDGSRVDGFLAHEAQEVVPEAVTGTKDAVDADGNPDYQGIDQSKLVPLLTSALQEAIAKIEDLETRLAAVEGAE